MSRHRALRRSRDSGSACDYEDRSETPSWATWKNAFIARRRPISVVRSALLEGRALTQLSRATAERREAWTSLRARRPPGHEEMS